MSTLLVFVRHAESENSARGLVNGDPSVDFPLTDQGRRQAETFAREIRGRFDLCLATGFRRTQETADIALTDTDVPYEIEPGLNDPPLGVFESKPEEDYVEWIDAHDWSIGPEGGGESQLDSVRRYVDAFERLIARPEARILVIGHAFPTGVARTLAYEPPPAVRPHYDCDFNYLQPVDIESAALAAGVARARRELSEVAPT